MDINDILNVLKADNWRFERKFLISGLSKYEIEGIIKLHPAMFSEIYQERAVNNIYFDTFEMSNYLDNINGNSHRIKVRIRWYGNLFGNIINPVLEFKIKKGAVGSKVSFPLDTIKIDNNLTIEAIYKVFKKTGAPDVVKFYLMNLRFSMLNCYTRKYFQSADKRFRITIDSGMRFITLSPMQNSFLNESVDYTRTVLELKYEKDDDYAERITNFFPFRLTRSSKYVTGIEQLNF